MSEWLNNVGKINNAQNIQQLKATEMDEYINSIYNYKEAKDSPSGDIYFTSAEKIIIGRMMECPLANEE